MTDCQLGTYRRQLWHRRADLLMRIPQRGQNLFRLSLIPHFFSESGPRAAKLFSACDAEESCRLTP